MPSSVSWNETAMTIAGGKMHAVSARQRTPVGACTTTSHADRLSFYARWRRRSTFWCRTIPAGVKSERPQWSARARLAAAHAWRWASWA